MKTDISLKLDQKAMLAGLLRVRMLLITILIIGLAGFTMYQISLITAISPDEATVTAERDLVDATRIKFDTQTIQAISRQNQITPSPSTTGIGKSDPFYQ